MQNRNQYQTPLSKSIQYIILDIIKKILCIISIIFIFSYLFKINIKIYSLSLVYSSVFILFSYLVHEDLFNGFTIYLGGMDGLQINSYANNMIISLKNFNFYEFFKGVESIFYFMPGIRYFFSINKILFAETTYGYLLIAFFYPILIFQILKILVGINLSIFITCISFLTRAFDGYAFSLYTQLEHIKEGDSEPLGITLFLFGIFLFLRFFKKTNYLNKNIFNFFILGACFSFSVIVRPNFLPGSIFIIFSLVMYLLLISKNYKQIIASLFGFSFLLFLPIHNYYYGNQLVFFTSGGVNLYSNIPFKTWFYLINDFLLFNHDNFNTKYHVVLSQIQRWIKPFEIHFTISFLIVLYVLFSRSKYYLKIICIACLLQHALLLYIVPDSRYAYLAWTLTFIINVYFVKNLYESIKVRIYK